MMNFSASTEYQYTVITLCSTVLLALIMIGTASRDIAARYISLTHRRTFLVGLCLFMLIGATLLSLLRPGTALAYSSLARLGTPNPADPPLVFVQPDSTWHIDCQLNSYPTPGNAFGDPEPISTVSSGGYSGMCNGTSSPYMASVGIFYEKPPVLFPSKVFEDYFKPPLGAPLVSNLACDVAVYIPTTNATAKNARYDFWGLDAMGESPVWLSWPGRTFNQEQVASQEQSGDWLLLTLKGVGVSLTGGDSQPQKSFSGLLVTLQDQDSTDANAKPAEELVASAIAYRCPSSPTGGSA